jgi:hypothetical protein
MGPLGKIKELKKMLSSVRSIEIKESVARSTKILRDIHDNPKLKKIYRLIDSCTTDERETITDFLAEDTFQSKIQSDELFLKENFNHLSSDQKFAKVKEVWDKAKKLESSDHCLSSTFLLYWRELEDEYWSEIKPYNETSIYSFIEGVWDDVWFEEKLKDLWANLKDKKVNHRKFQVDKYENLLFINQCDDSSSQKSERLIKIIKLYSYIEEFYMRLIYMRGFTELVTENLCRSLDEFLFNELGRILDYPELNLTQKEIFNDDIEFFRKTPIGELIKTPKICSKGKFSIKQLKRLKTALNLHLSHSTIDKHAKKKPISPPL